MGASGCITMNSEDKNLLYYLDCRNCLWFLDWNRPAGAPKKTVHRDQSGCAWVILCLLHTFTAFQGRCRSAWE